MGIKLSFSPYPLHFNFTARTSRGEVNNKIVYFINLSDSENPEIKGIGEAAPLEGLSPDFETLESKLAELSTIEFPNLSTLENLNFPDFPSLQFALETAILDFKNGGNKILFNSNFLKGKPIKINGLVWMADKETMLNELKHKISAGFDTIKIKVGAINFEEELSLLQYIRNHYSEQEINIRLDANGAFSQQDVFEKLNKLAEFKIHSIEQPIKQGNWELMKKVCEKSPIPIALDEELISNFDKKATLLDFIKPQFIILKPTLLGGFNQCKQWIDEAEKRNIAWWITSALESNIGLNAIAQFTATFSPTLPQGLGTGGLYTNNIPSNFVIKQGNLFYTNA
jgi:o-succinylbenzoate synthase